SKGCQEAHQSDLRQLLQLGTDLIGARDVDHRIHRRGDLGQEASSRRPSPTATAAGEEGEGEKAEAASPRHGRLTLQWPSPPCRLIASSSAFSGRTKPPAWAAGG